MWDPFRFGLLPGLLALTVMIGWMFLPLMVWFAYRRLRGVERALWAINTQLDQISKGGERGVLRQRSTDDRDDPPAEPRIKLSTFGR